MRDGAQAISYLEHLDRDPRAHRSDLVVLDMRLPKRDGEDILKRLRSTDRYGQTPVIVMTSSDSPRDHDCSQKHAALHYFRKPSTLDEFLEIGALVRNILGMPSRAENSELGGAA